ncbi:MAG: hypothetical protein U0559_08075 [Anaerolineae bacterium]
MTIDQIRSTLQHFQDGYTRRDVSRVDEIMTLFADDAEVIGTNGSRPGGRMVPDKAGARGLVKGGGKAGAIYGWMWPGRISKRAARLPGWPHTPP